MSIATQITRIQGLVSSLRTKIQSKGVTLANDADLEDCVDAVDSIEGGGGSDEPTGYAAEYFTIENIGSTVLKVYTRHGNSNNNSTNSNYNSYLNYNFEYSYDKETWTAVYGGGNSATEIFSIPVGGKAYMRALEPYAQRLSYKAYSGTLYRNWEYLSFWSSNARISGNIMSLFYRYDWKYKNTVAPYEFTYLFSGDTYLVDASNLVLPKGLNIYSCQMMFYGCTNLTGAPSLPYTDLYAYCYYGMFMNCSNLITAPELPATSHYLASHCYDYMFSGCTKLNYVKSLFASTDAAYTNSWLNNVASSGTFIKAAGSTWPEGINGIPSGWTVIEE